MKIKLYSFAKRQNSTKRPSGIGSEAGTEYECYLKDPSSVVNPVVLMEFSDKTQYYNYNYAYIATFGRYYFISDIVSMGNTWELSLVTDVLASFRGSIGNASMYVLRSAAAYDGRIVDTYYPVMTYHTYDTVYATNPMNNDNANGYPLVGSGQFIVGVIGYSSSSNNDYGSVLYFAMSQSALYRLVYALLNDAITSGNHYDFNELSQELQKSIIDPLSFIRSCMWLPVGRADVSSHSNPFNSFHIFDWDMSGSTIAAYPVDLNPPVIHKYFDMTITPHPWASSRGAYMNVEPYTRMSLTFPPFGTFELDTSKLSDQTAITCHTLLDVITGTAILRVVGKESGDILINVKAQVGVDINLSQITKDYVGSAMQAAEAGSKFMQLDLLGGAQSSIGSTVAAYKPLVSSLGGNGGFSELYGKVELQHTFFYPVDDDNVNAGRPLCEIRQLNTLSGYQKILDGDIEIPGTAGEQAAVKAFLEGGYFYE